MGESWRTPCFTGSTSLARTGWRSRAARRRRPVALKGIPGQLAAMDEDVLYRRALPHGPVILIRRTSARGARPVTAVLELDRRAGTPREGVGTPPALMQVEAADEAAALSTLEAHAKDDRAIAALLRERQLR